MKWYVKPDAYQIRDFFDVDEKRIVIPSIQRQFVWDEEKIKELIDSIVNGYPIGSVIYLKSKLDFPYAPLIGKVFESKEKKYVIDGQQRLTALMLIKNNWELERETRTISVNPIYYNPESEPTFYISEKRKRGINVSLLVKTALGDDDVRDNLRRDFPETYKSAIEDIGRRIVDYKIPYYTIKPVDEKGDVDYADIAEMFTRVNSAGVKIGNLEMFLSFFAATFKKGEAKKRIIDIYDKFDELVGLDLEPIIRFVFSKMNMSQNQITRIKSFKPAMNNLTRNYTENTLMNIINKSETAIGLVFAIIKAETGLSTTYYIPSQNVLLVLFNYVYNRGFKCIGDISTKERRKMLKWFLVTSFEGYYSTSYINRKIEDDLELLNENRTRTFPLEKLLVAMEKREYSNTIDKNWILKRYDEDDAYRGGKEYQLSLYTLLVKNSANDWTGKPIKGNENTLAIHHIFPREFLKESNINERESINSFCNLTFIDGAMNKRISSTPPEEYLEKIKPMTLHQHFIPTDKKLWKVQKYQKFLKERAKLIWNAIEAKLL